MLDSLQRDSSDVLAEYVVRQRFALEKLQRDGGYPCEIQSARKILRSFEARLAAARRREESA